MKKRHAVIVGGQHTGAEELERVAHALVDSGWAHDAAVYTLWRGMRESYKLAHDVNRARVLGHSLAGLPVSRAVELYGARPDFVLDWNGPEPMTFKQMVHRAVTKYLQARRPDADPGLQKIMGHNLEEGVRHPLGNTRHLPDLRRFSAFAKLENYRRAGIGVLAVRHDDDQMAPYDPQSKPPDVKVLLRSGLHDQLLIDPEVEVREVVRELDAGSRESTRVL